MEEGTFASEEYDITTEKEAKTREGVVPRERRPKKLNREHRQFSSLDEIYWLAKEIDCFGECVVEWLFVWCQIILIETYESKICLKWLTKCSLLVGVTA